MNKEEKMIRIQALEQQAAEVQLRMEEISRAVAENQLTLAALEELEKNARTFSAIGSGVYVKTRVDDAENVLMSLGEDVLAEYPVGKVKEKLKQAQEKLEEDLRQLSALYSRIREEYSELLREEGA